MNKFIRKNLILSVLLVAGPFWLKGQPISLDSSFNKRGECIVDFKTKSEDLADMLIDAKNRTLLLVAYDSTLPPYQHFEAIALRRILADGTPDNSFGRSGKEVTIDWTVRSLVPKAMTLDEHGRIYVVSNGQSQTELFIVVVRYNPDGSVDTTYGKAGFAFLPFGNNFAWAKSMAIQKDGKLVLAGGYYGSIYRSLLIRLDSSGRPDSTFGGTGIIKKNSGSANSYFSSMGFQRDGKIIAAGYAEVNSSVHFQVFRFHLNGNPDSSFGNNGSALRQVKEGVPENNGIFMSLDSGENITVSGAFTYSTEIWRLTKSGKSDVVFNDSGLLSIRQKADHKETNQWLAVQNDGKIVVGGYWGQFMQEQYLMFRVDRFGKDDSTFFNKLNYRKDCYPNSQRCVGRRVVIHGDYLYFAGSVMDFDANADIFVHRYHIQNRNVSSTMALAGESTVGVFPNPTNGDSRLVYTLGNEANVTVNVYNGLGQLIFTPLSNVKQVSGYHHIALNIPETFGSGVYTIQLLASGQSRTIKLLRL